MHGSNRTQKKCLKKVNFDLLMGVGAKYYPDSAFFVEEVLRLGLSKRLPDFPEFFDPKENKLWLVHWADRVIFGYVTNLKFRIFAEPGSEECRKAKEEYGEDHVICAPLGSLPGDFAERGCGKLKGDGKYVKQEKTI